MPKIIYTKVRRKIFCDGYVPYRNFLNFANKNNSQTSKKCNKKVQCVETRDKVLLPDRDRPSCSKDVQGTHRSNLENELNSEPGPSMPKHAKRTDHACMKNVKVNGESCRKNVEVDGESCMKNVKFNGETPDSENGADSNLKRSQRKRKKDPEEPCPICGVTVRHSELQNHYAKEVDSLKDIAKNMRRVPVSARRKHYARGINRAVYQVKNNRESRIAKNKDKYAEIKTVMCPVCKTTVAGTVEDINEHVFSCFEEDNEVNVTDNDDYNYDYDDDDSFEEFVIGTETRVRAISLVPGGHRALHGSSSQSRPTDEDADLNVDVEGTQAFGKPQYTELDVIHDIGSSSRSQTGNQRDRETQLRRAVAFESSAEPQVKRRNKWSRNSEIENEVEKINGSCSKDESSGEEEKDTKEEEKDARNDGNEKSHDASTSKEKIRDMDQEKNVKCLICLEPYTRPVVSTTCWHVHCEECWLVSMGVKKLCPQCNMIVCPTDLRRIYL